MFNEDASPKEGLGQFFDSIWREQEGYVYLPTHDPKSEEWKALMYKWPIHKKHVVDHVLTSSAKGLNVFFAPAIFKGPSPKKENVLGSHVVWTDFDGNAPREWADDPQDGTEPAPGAPDGLPAPSLRVQSSTESHEHVYWFLDNFETDVPRIEGINRSISYTYRADTSGWDANQILRPPYTTNYKHDLPVTVAKFDGKRSPIDKFKSLKPILELVSDSIDTENLPTVERIIAKYPWDDEHFEMFMDPQIPEGKRSSALMRLGYFGAERGMTDSEIYALLENADSRWGKFAKRSDKKKRLLDIVNRAKTKHPTPTNNLTFMGLQSQDQKPVAVDQRYIYGFKDFLEEDIKVEWMIEGLLEVGGFGMIAAAPGVGKTQLSLQLACAAALGNDFIDYSIPSPQKIVFFSLEMGSVALRFLLETVTRHYTEEQVNVLQERVIIVPLGESLPVERTESLEFLKSILDEVRPTGVIFDSLSKLTGGKFNAEGAAKVNDFYAALRARYGVSVVTVHHNRKANGDNKRPTQLSDVYGEVYFTSDMTFVMTMWRETDWDKSKIEIAVVKNRLAIERDPMMFTRDENLHFTCDRTRDIGVGEGLIKKHESSADAPKGQDGFSL